MDLFWQANWAELHEFFAQGTPPLAIQLLCVNTIFFMLWIVRRMRGASAMRKETSIATQALLIAANAIILFQKNLLGYVT